MTRGKGISLAAVAFALAASAALIACGEEEKSYSDKQIVAKLDLKETKDQGQPLLRGGAEPPQRLGRGRQGRGQGQARSRDLEFRGQRWRRRRPGLPPRLRAAGQEGAQPPRSEAGGLGEESDVRGE